MAYRMPGRRRKEQLKKTRLQTFIRGWNNLLNRTTSKSKDMQIIFANILDFHASSISRLHPNDGLVAILRSCEELPMSLLYNVGPRLEDQAAVGDSWLPIPIDGLPLHDRGILQRTEAGLKLSIKDMDDNAVEIWLSEVKIPYQETAFQVRDSDTGHLYVVEKQVNTFSNREVEAKKEQAYENAIATCIMIDKREGTTSIDGYTGRGALLTVYEIVDSGQTIRVQFQSQLRFWTPAQWEQDRDISSQLTCYPVQAIHPHQTLLLETGTSYAVSYPLSFPRTASTNTEPRTAPNKWTHPFPRRALLIPRTNTYSISQMYAIFIGIAIAEAFVAILYPLEAEGQEKSHGGTKFLVRFVAQIGIATAIIRTLQWRSRRRYERWFGIFEEGWRPEEDEEGKGSWSEWREWVRRGGEWLGLRRREARGEIEL